MPHLPQQAVGPRSLVGREVELAGLRSLVERSQNGYGQLVLLSGEAGIGKSRLAAEVATRAQGRGFLVLQAACFPPDRASPFAPLLDLLGSKPAANLEPLARELALLHPGLVAEPPMERPLPALDPELARRRLFGSLTQFFTHLSLAQPLLLLVEDIHWADDASLELLHSLGRRCAEYPLLLVVTYRDDEIHAGLRDWLAQINRERLALEFPLAPLAQGDVAALLRAILGLPGPLHPQTLDTIYELTEGNPFFVEEMAKSLATARGGASAVEIWAGQPLGELHVPRSVQAAVQQRAERLSEAARQVLVLAAVAGRRFDFEPLEALVHRNEQELLGLMKELIAAQLVVEESDAQFAFRHALTREAVYAQLLLRERKALHRAVAETMERIFAAELDAHVGELAAHYYEAGAWEKVLAYAQRAGERARDMYAPRVAIEQFTRALQAAQQVEAGRTPLLYHLRGQAHEVVGEFDQARADFESAFAAAETGRDGPTQWQALMDQGFLWAGRDYGRAGHFFQEAVLLAERLGDPGLQAHSLNRLGNWLVNTGQVAEGLQAHERALSAFELRQDREGMAETFDLLALAQSWTGDMVAAVEQQRRAVELLRELGDKKGLASALPIVTLAGCPTACDTVCATDILLEECERAAVEAAGLAREIDWPSGEAFAEECLGILLAGTGQFGRGLAHARTALQIAEEIDHRQWMVGAHSNLAQIYLLVLQPELALQHLETALPMAEALGSAYFIGDIRASQALAYLHSGECKRAEQALRAVVPDELEPRTLQERHLVRVSGELALAQGKPQAALEIARGLQASAPGGPCTQPIPWLCKLAGEALAALGHYEEAAEALEAARRGAAGRREAPLLWQIDGSLARVYHALRRQQEARDHVAQARAGIEALASTIDDAALRGRFSQAALASLPRQRPVSARRAAAERFAGLTERERAVAALVAQGQSNREIAQQLVVSERTVETHVANILFKLGFDSRTQVAAWAVKVGLDKA